MMFNLEFVEICFIHSHKNIFNYNIIRETVKVEYNYN